METDVSQQLPSHPEDTGQLINVFSKAEILVLQHTLHTSRGLSVCCYHYTANHSFCGIVSTRICRIRTYCAEKEKKNMLLQENISVK